MDARGWDQRYAATDLVWSAGPNRTVADQVTGLQPGSALDLACGEGRNALWPAEQGWTAIAKGRTAADRRGLDVRLLVADVTSWEPDRVFDLVVVTYLQLPWEQLRAALATAAGALAPGGTFLLVAHDLANLDGGVGGPQDPAVLHTPEQVTAALDGLRVDVAERVRRPVEVDGEVRYAIDSLVRGTAPSRGCTGSAPAPQAVRARRAEAAGGRGFGAATAGRRRSGRAHAPTRPPAR